MQKININLILFETIVLFCKYLVSTIKANKLTLKILVNENIFSNFALFFVLQNLKLLKYYTKKFEIIKTNLTIYQILISKNKLICKRIACKFIDILVTSC